MYTNGSEKSNRSKADYFELLLTESLIKRYGINKSYQKDIAERKAWIIVNFPDGKDRVIEQESRVPSTSSKLIDFLFTENITVAKDVDWVGRLHQTEHTISDIDVILPNNDIIGISVKSVKVGSGTQKNLGYSSLKRYLLLDIDIELEEMWRKIRQELRLSVDHKIRALSGLPRRAIKDYKRIFPVIRTIGEKYGHPVQVSSVKQSIDNFNGLPELGKGTFMKLVFGVEKNRRVLNVLAREREVEIKWNRVQDAIVSGKDLRAYRIGDVSYGIYLESDLVIRVQASFTNGIGISAFCQRAFLA